MPRFRPVVLALTGLAVIGLSDRATATEWTPTTLHSFQGGSDGDVPSGGLIADQAGRLYGTTSGSDKTGDYGTVYQMTPPATQGDAWQEQVLLNFGGGHLGNAPMGNLVLTGGSLYGTTYSGGVIYGTGILSGGNGGVFSFTPPSIAGGA